MRNDETRPLGQADTPGTDAPVKGRLVGRYVLLEPLGSGGSGDVFSAFDPALDRRVAVKLLRAAGEGTNALTREGRLLAKLVHPSVVAIHDSGVDQGQPYLAMELVDGPDIRDFARAERDTPGSAALVQSLLDVGEGLAAAHRIGVVHGDVKPSNILRDGDGRTKLSDFGIAQLSGTGELQPGAGTPAFMAPEQHAGAAGSELADQYSFCLTAFVLLHGEHPFLEGAESLVTSGASNDTPKARTEGTQGRLEAHAQTTRTPRWRPEVPRTVARALGRGLSLDPADRWPSMDALLEALRVRRGRVVPWILAFGGLAAAASVAVAVAVSPDDEPPEPCARAGQAIDDSWNAEGLAQLRVAWAPSPEAFASSLEHVVDSLDRFAAVWREASVEVCEATHTHGLQSPEMLDVRSDCLRHATVSLEEVLDLLATNDPEIWAEAADVVEGLPDPKRCVETTASTLPKAKSAEQRERYEEAERLLERARYALDAVALERAQAALDSAQPQVQDEPKLETLYLRQRARLLDWQGEPEKTQSTAKRALYLALAQGDITSAVSVLSLLAALLGEQAGGLDQAQDYAAMAIALSGHADATDEERFSAQIGMGSVLRRKGEFDQALTHFRSALEIGIPAFGESSPDVAGLRAHISATLQDTGRLEEALAEQLAALEARVQFYGPDHPMVAQSHHNLSRLYYDMGRGEAEHHTRRALEILIGAVGPDQVPVAIVQGGLGDEMRRQGRYDEALQLYEDAIETLTNLVGQTAPDTLVLRASHAVTLGNLGRDALALEELDAVLAATREALGESHIYVARVHLFRGAVRLHVEDLEGAGEDYAAASQVYVEQGTPQHSGRVRALVGLADVAQRAGDLVRAEAAYAEAETLLDASGEPAGAVRARLDEGMGELALARGRHDEARERLTRALALLAKGVSDQALRAEITLRLAEAERAAGREQVASEHAQAALALLDAAPADDESLRQAIADFKLGIH